MKQTALQTAEPSGRGFRRFPGLTAADVAALNALEPAMARELEALIRSQERSDRRHRRLCPVLLDERDEGHHARWSHGPGGGRRRPTHAGQA